MSISLKCGVKNKKSPLQWEVFSRCSGLFILCGSQFLVKQTSEFLKYLFLKRHVRLEAF